MIFSAISRVVESMYSSENYFVFKNIKQETLSPAVNYDYLNDDTDNTSDFPDDENNSSGTDPGLKFDRLAIRSKVYRHSHRKKSNVPDLRFTSPTSSPLFSSPYQLRTSDPLSPMARSPSKSMSLFDNRDISPLPLNVTIEFNVNQDLVYISPCVFQLLGYDATELIDANTTLFTHLPAIPSNTSSLTYTTQIEPNNRVEQKHHSKDIFVVANALLRVGGIKSISIIYKACEASGGVVAMEGQGMLLEQYGKVSMVWVTRIIDGEESVGISGNLSKDNDDVIAMNLKKFPVKKISRRVSDGVDNAKISIDESGSGEGNGGVGAWGKEFVDVLNDLGLCHICDRSIPVTLFGGHTKVCSAAHHAG